MNAEISAFTNMTEVLRFGNADISVFTNMWSSVNAIISAFTYYMWSRANAVISAFACKHFFVNA